MRQKTVLFFFIILGLVLPLNRAQGSYTLKQIDRGIISSGDSFSVDIQDTFLDEVLKQIALQNNIKFLLIPSLAQEKVMVRFFNLKLDEGLRKILTPYDTIFIYRERNHKFPEHSVTSLKEVRVYPYHHKGALKEPFMVISKGSVVSVKDKGKDEHKTVENSKLKKSERREKLPFAALSWDLSDNNATVRKEAVKTLAKSKDEKAIGLLARAMRDKNPKVKREAEEALKLWGEQLKDENKKREEEEEVNREEEKPPSDKGKTELSVGSTGNVVTLMLDSNVSVRGVQFTLKGAQPVEIRTTPRTEGFFARFNRQNGMVVLVSLSGNEIPPGKGPIAEIVCTNAGSASISEQKIVE